jgi:hypothetical protein
VNEVYPDAVSLYGLLGQVIVSTESGGPDTVYSVVIETVDGDHIPELLALAEGQ